MYTNIPILLLRKFFMLWY